MQKCSELASNLEVWQYLSRYDLRGLQVIKRPEGHRLVEECHDQLKKVLPTNSYDKLMVWIKRWLKSLDEKDAKTKEIQNSRKKKVQLSCKSKPISVIKNDNDSKKDTKNDNSVVDLCSDGEISENQSDNLFDCNTVVAKSQLVIHDDEFGDINLKDYAAHIDKKQSNQPENEENNQGTVNMPSDHANDDENIAQTSSGKNLELTVGAKNMKTYLNTSSKPKPKETLIRVRTDLTATPLSSGNQLDLQKGNITQCHPYPSKRKLSIEQPRKSCDSTTEGSESCPKKHKQNSDKDLSVLVQKSINKASPDTTSISSINIIDPNPILNLNHILGLLDCVESYATWQHNKEATKLLVQLRGSLQQKTQTDNK